MIKKKKDKKLDYFKDDGSTIGVLARDPGWKDFRDPGKPLTIEQIKTRLRFSDSGRNK